MNYEVTVKLIVSAESETEAEDAVERLIDSGKLSLLDEDEDILREYNIEEVEIGDL